MLLDTSNMSIILWTIAQGEATQLPLSLNLTALPQLMVLRALLGHHKGPC